jgi:hypothetical protein
VGGIVVVLTNYYVFVMMMLMDLLKEGIFVSYSFVSLSLQSKIDSFQSLGRGGCKSLLHSLNYTQSTLALFTFLPIII